MLAFLCLTTLVTGLLFGVAPAFHASGHHLSDVLKEEGRSSGSTFRARRLTTGLLVAEFALTLVLLTGAGLMIRSFYALYRASLVVESSDLLTMTLRITGAPYPTQDHRKAFYKAVEERLSARGEIAAATMASICRSLEGISGPWRSTGGPRPPACRRRR